MAKNYVPELYDFAQMDLGRVVYIAKFDLSLHQLLVHQDGIAPYHKPKNIFTVVVYIHEIRW